ncbi:MAG: 5-deoxy-glucuronate isomerase [Balneolales bacterium]
MDKKNIIVSDTASRAGRCLPITPENSALNGLAYGRIILNRQVNDITYNTGSREMSLICLHGSGTVQAGGKTFTLGSYDTVYVPPHTLIRVKTEEGFDLVESSAPSDHQGEPEFVSFSALQNDPVLHMELGTPACKRTLYRLIDDNVKASRLLCGLIFSEDGNWTSWAPHEHAETKEEIYLYFDMPAPAFGIQMIYEDLRNPEFVAPVFENDAVVIKKGYHPNVAIPGHPMNFVWMMATNDASMKRSWADVNTQPAFKK